MGNLYNHPCTNNGRLWWENATNKSLVARVVWFCSFSILYNSNLVPSLFVAEAFLSELEWEATLKCAKASLYMLNTKCTIKYGLNHTVDAKKLCTTWHVWNLTTNGINYQPQLVRRISKFLPSTAYWVETLHQDIHTYIYIYIYYILYIYSMYQVYYHLRVPETTGVFPGDTCNCQSQCKWDFNTTTDLF